jgi:hypothetical protein
LELSAAAIEFDRDWSQVASKLNDVFGCSLTNSQCQKRWSQYVAPDVLDRKGGMWSAEEVSLVSLLFKGSPMLCKISVICYYIFFVQAIVYKMCNLYFAVCFLLCFV